MKQKPELQAYLDGLRGIALAIIFSALAWGAIVLIIYILAEVT